MCYQLLVQVRPDLHRAVLEAIFVESGLRTANAELNGQRALCLTVDGGCSCSLVIDRGPDVADSCTLEAGYHELVVRALTAAERLSPLLDFAFRWTADSDSVIEHVEHLQLGELVERVRAESIHSDTVYRIGRA